MSEGVLVDGDDSKGFAGISRHVSCHRRHMVAHLEPGPAGLYWVETGPWPLEVGRTGDLPKPDWEPERWFLFWLASLSLIQSCHSQHRLAQSFEPYR